MRKSLLFGLILLCGCNELDEFIEDVLHDDNTVMVATPEPTAVPTPIEVDVVPAKNPGCVGVQPFKGGTLWKPKSDSTGNLAVLLASKFVEPFSCSVVVKKNGKIESLDFQGFSNGERQTFRGSKPGGKYEDDGEVTCVDSGQTCVFKFSGKSSERHE